ncbi:AMP-binding protein [Lactiplantibacillus plantarum]
MNDNDFVKHCLLSQRADKIAIVSDKKKYTYLEIRENIAKYADQLKNFFLPGDKIGFLCDDSPEYVFLFWAAIISGVVPVLINVQNDQANCNYIVGDCQCKCVVVNKDELGCKINNCKVMKISDLNQSEVQSSQLENKAWSLQKDYAFVLYTSGSTGKPKGVPHKIKDMEFCAKNFQNTELAFQESDVIYSVSKIPFAFGFGNIIYLPFYSKATICISDDNDIFAIKKFISKVKPTILMAVPTIYNNFLKVFSEAPASVKSIRLTISCGEVLPTIVAKRWLNYSGNVLLEGMGTTEFLYTFLINTLKENEPGSTGKPVPGYIVKVVDKNLHEQSVGKIGDLFVKADSLMEGYLNRNNEDMNLLRDGGMLTGDQFVVDKKGYFWYKGRSLDNFKVNGKWVRAEDIENEVLDNKYIKDVAVIAANSDERVTQIACYMVLEEGFNLQTLKQQLRKKLEHYKLPNYYYRVKEIPKGITGKIQRKALINLDKEELQ